MGARPQPVPDGGARAHRGSIVTSDEKETLEAGRMLARACLPGEVIALSGDLGAGKTVLVKGIATGMGVREVVPSPTFNLLLVHQGCVPLFHFDLYRLDSPGQLEDIDFYETVEAGGGVSAIEWADRFPGEMPADRLDVCLTRRESDAREIAVTGTGPRSAAVAQMWLAAWEARS